MRTLCLALVLTATAALAADDPPYVFKRGDSSIIRGIPIRSIGKVVRRWSGDYIWTRRDGREYLIRDAVTLNEARQAFAELDAMAREVDAFHSNRLRPAERRQDDLEDRIESIEERLEDEDRDLSDSERRELEARKRELREKMRAAERELRPLEEEERRLDDRHEAIEKEAEEELEQIIRRAIRRGVAERVD